jgi:hypothetical protein
MVQLDTRLPMMIQTPNILGAMDQGTVNASNMAGLMRQAEGQNLFRQHGAGAMQGDMNALAQIAGFDPELGQAMDIRRQENVRADQRLSLDRERIDILRKETMRSLAEAQDQAAAKAEAEQFDKLATAAIRAHAAGDQASWERLTMEAFDAPLPFDENGVAALAASHEGAKTYLSSRPKTAPDYVTLNDQLVDRNAPGGPAVVPVAGIGGPGASGVPADVQSSTILPGGMGAITVMKNGAVQVTTAAGQTLEGQAAQDYAQEAYRLRNELERELYGARRTGQNEAEAATGADAAAAGERGQQGVKLAAEFFTEARTVRSSLGNIRDAIRAIDEGAKSGVVYNMLPNITVASATLANAANRLGLDVIGSVTFGALSEGEMRLAMDTAVPRDLEAAELKVWLERKQAAQEKALEGIEEAIVHFDSGGTMAEWTRKMQGLQRPPETPASTTRPEQGPPPPANAGVPEYPDFATFSAAPAIKRAAELSGGSIEGMWEIYQERQKAGQ